MQIIPSCMACLLYSAVPVWSWLPDFATSWMLNIVHVQSVLSWIVVRLARVQERAKQWFQSRSIEEWDVTDFWNTTHKQLECHVCQRERKRMALVVHRGRSCGMTLEDAIAILNSRRFEESVLITEYNRPVTLYAQLRSQTFARVRSQQLLWIQALDTPPAEHFGDHSAKDLEAFKRVRVGRSCSKNRRRVVALPLYFRFAMPYH